MNEFRNATVKVESQNVSLLVLTRDDFYKLIESGGLNRSVLEGVKQVDRARQAVNEEEMTVVKVEGGNGEGGGDDNNE